MTPRSLTACIKLPRLGSYLLLALLSACGGGNDMTDLQEHIVQVSMRPGGEIEPIPEFRNYEAFTYASASMRSPFDVPLSAQMREAGLNVVMVEPDENRQREPLEEFALTGISMVGMLSRGNAYIGLVRDEMGIIHRVAVGNYMGRNHGRIRAVTPSQIDVVEIVPSGDGGWIERPRSLVLQR